MNTNRPHEDLDADERDLARVVRALPGNEPPAALDLRILKAAQDAVAATPTTRTRRALWATNSAGSLWGFGTAAAAVLAVGISWQLFMQSPTSNLPSSSPAAVADNAAKDRDATSVDFIPPPKLEQPAADQVASSAPASPPMLQAPRPASAVASAEKATRQESKQVVSVPQPFLDEHVATEAQSEADALKPSRDKRADTGSASADFARAENAPAENAVNESAGGAPVVAMAAPAAAPASAASPPEDRERREQSTLAKTAASSGMLAGAAAPIGQADAPAATKTAETVQDAKYRVRLDARLYPESWILKIRSRLKHGDTAGARASLKLFVERYPQETVPANLKPLLDE